MSRKYFSLSRSKSTGDSRGRTPRGLGIEPLEGRAMMATLAVDIGDVSCADAGDSLYCQIQEAIDVADAGDEIHVADGTYEPIRVRTDDLTIQASDGATPVIDATRAANGVSVNAADRVTIRGINVDNARVAGFSLVSSNSNVLQGNSANDGSQDGFVLENSDNNTLMENTAEGNVRNGFFVTNGSDSNTLEHNSSVDNNNGFVVSLGELNVLRTNVADANHTRGFFLFPSRITAEGNIAQYNGETGIMVWSGDGFSTLIGNTARGNGARDEEGAGIVVARSSSNTILDNVSVENFGVGFFVGNGDNNIVRGNLAQGNIGTSDDWLGDGFMVRANASDTKNNTFEDNTAIDNSGRGFAVIEPTPGLVSDSNTLRNNTVSGNEGLAFHVDQLRDNVFENNNCGETGGDSSSVPCSEFQAGDANLDGQFNQLDIVQVMQAAKYNTGEGAPWSHGDWNHDGLFDQADIVAALQAGNYAA